MIQDHPPTVPSAGHGLDSDTQVFFYEQEFYPLSNFSAFTLDWKGIRFDTSEAAYHWEKFTNLHSNFSSRVVIGPVDSGTVGEKIRMAESAHEAFKIAEANKHLVRLDWMDVRVSIMRDILFAKAHQHEYVRRKLLQSGDRELIENSWRDSFWGWGPDRKGQNQLGKLWMEVRAELQSESVRTFDGEPPSVK
jgi:ribA/ribD-fused uncharacterized protein